MDFQPILVVLLSLILISSVFAQDLSTSEGDVVLEEKYADEILEDKAGITPDSALYVVDKAVENINLAVRSGEKKVEYAVAMKEEKIAEALLMTDADKPNAAGAALIRAKDVSEVIEDEVGFELADGVYQSAEVSKELLEFMKGKLPTEEEWQSVMSLVNSQLTKEEKIKIASTLVKKIANYCDGLAKLDYELMVQDKHCDPSQAPEWLQDYINEEIRKRQKEAEKMMVDMINTCIKDARQCECDKIPVKSERKECEKNTYLAVKCEFDMDLSACEELDKIGVKAPESMPDFLKPIFEETLSRLIEKKKKDMFAKFAPKECVEAGAFSMEECMAIMEQKYGPIPQECIRNGKPISQEECSAIMQEKYGTMPKECIRDNKPIPKEECEAIMEEKYITIPEDMPPTLEGIPNECIKDGQFVGADECNRIMQEIFSRAPPIEDLFPIEEPKAVEIEPAPVEPQPIEEPKELVTEYVEEEITYTPELLELKEEIEKLQELKEKEIVVEAEISKEVKEEITEEPKPSQTEPKPELEVKEDSG